MTSLSSSDSDVVHVDVLGSHVVILNSIEAATELLERRSSIYSDRHGSPPNMVSSTNIYQLDTD